MNTGLQDWPGFLLWEGRMCALWKRSVASCILCLRSCRMFSLILCSWASHCLLRSSKALIGKETDSRLNPHGLSTCAYPYCYFEWPIKYLSRMGWAENLGDVYILGLSQTYDTRIKKKNDCNKSTTYFLRRLVSKEYLWARILQALCSCSNICRSFSWTPS